MLSEFPEWSATPWYLRVQVTFQGTSGLPEDSFVNTWHFVQDKTVNDLEDISDALQAYYTSVTPNLSNMVSRTGATMKFYDLEIAAPNPPLATVPLTVAAAATSLNMPSELAVVMSFQSSPAIGGVNQARRRGRVYLGPFCGDASATNYERPASGLVDAFAGYGDTLLATSEASLYWRWAVFSPTSAGGWMIPGQQGPPNFPPSVSPVTDGWVDNAWDIQRRRGLAPTARTTFS